MISEISTSQSVKLPTSLSRDIFGRKFFTNSMLVRGKEGSVALPILSECCIHLFMFIANMYCFAPGAVD